MGLEKGFDFEGRESEFQLDELAGSWQLSDLYNPYWGTNVENASFLWDGGVGEVDGSAAPNGTF